MLSEKSRKLFLEDSLALARKALRALRDLDAHPDARQVRQLFHAIHSFKGTAAMVPDAGDVVAPLQKIEAVLTLGGDFEGLARRHQQWRGAALGALELALKALKVLKGSSSALALAPTGSPVVPAPEANPEVADWVWILHEVSGTSVRRIHVRLEDIIEFRPRSGGLATGAPASPCESWEGYWIRRYHLGNAASTDARPGLSLLIQVPSASAEGVPAVCVLTLGSESRLGKIVSAGEAQALGSAPWEPHLETAPEVTAENAA